MPLLELKAGVARRHAGASVRAAGVVDRLAAMTPRPETNLLICGVLAPLGRWRVRVAAYGRQGRREAETGYNGPALAGPRSAG